MKMKIYQEEAKTRQTSHWDCDYMTTEQIDALMNAKQSTDSKRAKVQPDTAKRKIRLNRTLIGLIGIALTLLVSVVAFRTE